MRSPVLNCFMLVCLMVFVPAAWAEGDVPQVSLCQAMLEAANQAVVGPQFELEVFQGKNSTSLMAFMAYDTGDDINSMIGELEFKIVGLNNDILKIKSFKTKKLENFRDISGILLARVLSMHPNVRIIRETWAGHQMLDMMQALQNDHRPTVAIEKSPRGLLYAKHGFKYIRNFNFDFDKRESMIMLDLDFSREAVNWAP